jgi:DHA2 family multidrug resistance protein
MSTVAFATIAPEYRADATSLFSLVRNIGSSIGISVVSVMLTRNVQINHAELGAAISTYNPNAVGALQSMGRSPLTLQIMDGMVNQQALMIGYINDFKLMMIVTLAALPLIWLLRKPAPRRPGPDPPLDRRSLGRHHQLLARHAALGDFHRAGA